MGRFCLAYLHRCRCQRAWMCCWWNRRSWAPKNPRCRWDTLKRQTSEASEASDISITAARKLCIFNGRVKNRHRGVRLADLTAAATLCAFKMQGATSQCLNGGGASPQWVLRQSLLKWRKNRLYSLRAHEHRCRETGFAHQKCALCVSAARSVRTCLSHKLPAVTCRVWWRHTGLVQLLQMCPALWIRRALQGSCICLNEICRRWRLRMWS